MPSPALTGARGRAQHETRGDGAVRRGGGAALPPPHRGQEGQPACPSAPKRTRAQAEHGVGPERPRVAAQVEEAGKSDARPVSMSDAGKGRAARSLRWLYQHFSPDGGVGVYPCSGSVGSLKRMASVVELYSHVPTPLTPRSICGQLGFKHVLPVCCSCRVLVWAGRRHRQRHPLREQPVRTPPIADTDTTERPLPPLLLEAADATLAFSQQGHKDLLNPLPPLPAGHNSVTASDWRMRWSYRLLSAMRVHGAAQPQRLLTPASS